MKFISNEKIKNNKYIFIIIWLVFVGVITHSDWLIVTDYRALFSRNIHRPITGWQKQSKK